MEGGLGIQSLIQMRHGLVGKLAWKIMSDSQLIVHMLNSNTRVIWEIHYLICRGRNILSSSSWRINHI